MSGPSWLDTERFRIVARVPAGATKEQAPVMLQRLLAERSKGEAAPGDEGYPDLRIDSG
ncbi:MAG TPA: TIGR03435 family protein [Bryobacteraceae bacterium]|nr:TIGR03435 family protein [Bryobacteraceae bacterium]